MANNNGNILNELASAMRCRDHQLTAMALRALAQHGYTSLAEVESTIDCELLAIRGIGPGRLGAIRQLTQPDWRPPSRQAVRTARRLLHTTQLALRFWSVEELESALQGTKPAQPENRPAETQLSIEAFASATQEAADHHDLDALKQIVQRASELANHNQETGGDR